ncbi:hypothetical protein [Mycolicibacterium sphagni]|uniref:Uncharacterized protein n=1 Tax=Mycolicibacterium sphagni TaxID=1786 RepID=A0A255DR86_9MYCO|nr:hypothetical protein [Mycolicibacterium sphagni]OYN81754.1 hypothetical protein CG716_05260 [Mycolicibacterium sphagni]
MSDLKAALEQLEAAITDQGPQPDYHRRVMSDVQSSWPTLWQATQNIRKAAHEFDQLKIVIEVLREEIADLRPLVEKCQDKEIELRYWANR